MPRPSLLPRPTARRLNATAVPLAVVTALLLGAGPASAQDSPAVPEGPEATASSTQDVQAQLGRIAQLQQQATNQQDQVSAAQAELRAAGTRSGAALEAYTTATRALDATQQSEVRQQQVYAASKAQADQGRTELGRWARAAYTGGNVLDGSGLVATVLTARTTDALGANLVVLSRLGDERAAVVHGFETARAAQQTARDAAEQAAVQAADAAVAAASARDAATTAVATQKKVVAKLEAGLDDTQDQLADAEAAGQAADQYRATMKSANVVSGEVGDCAGGDTSSFPNGQISLDALCPLWGTTQHRLRADAANGFNQMSQAYAQAFGKPICVTDSYRTLAEQIDLKKRKPTLAAKPGTSNHGWGTATDLCGGIQTFSTSQHDWMVTNAPLYGWFHPAWAQASGSKPEPWHFEYGG